MNFDVKKIMPSFHLPRYGDVIHPTRDWFAVLIVSFLLLIGSLGWNVWLFSRVVGGKFIGSTVPVAATSTLSSLDAVREIVEMRRAEENRYRTEASFVDPSH